LNPFNGIERWLNLSGAGAKCEVSRIHSMELKEPHQLRWRTLIGGLRIHSMELKDFHGVVEVQDRFIKSNPFNGIESNSPLGHLAFFHIQESIQWN